MTHSTRIVEPASWWGEVEPRTAVAHPENIGNVGVNAGSVSVSHVGSSVRLRGRTSGRARGGFASRDLWLGLAYEVSMRKLSRINSEIWFRPFSCSSTCWQGRLDCFEDWRIRGQQGRRRQRHRQRTRRSKRPFIAAATCSTIQGQRSLLLPSPQ
jgi:hypothetical protein